MPQAQEKPKTIVLRPYHRAKSDRIAIKDGETPESVAASPNKVFLDGPEKLRIDNHSFVVDKVTGNRRPIRWYVGCTSIFLDEQRKYEKDNQMEARKIEYKDAIYISNGATDFSDEGQFKTLFEFLKRHNDNMSNPDRVPAPDGEGYGVFCEIDTAKDAREELDSMESLEIAFGMLNETKRGTGAVREWNEPALNKLKSIFGVTAGSNEESYIELRTIAQGNSKEFVSRVEQAKAYIIADFEAAKQCKAITYKDNKFFIDNEKVFTASDPNIAKQDAEFIEFLSKEGSPVYLKMREQITINQLDPK